MGFTLSKRPRLHKREYLNELNMLVLSLTFRELTPDERDAYELELAKIRNNPQLSDEEKEAARKEERRRAAEKAIVGWELVEDDDGNPLDPSLENVREFTLDPETEKFWEPYMSAYLNPWTRVGKVEGEKRLDPRS